jgi:phenylalanyl-tRNA synthetase beta chain
MRVPLSWLREHVELPAGLSAREVAAGLVRVGLEVETVEEVAPGLSGPLVLGRVGAMEEFTASNGKTIRFCRVDVGVHNPEDGLRGIVCGAQNFVVGDLVVVALPGAVLPGDFAIASRTTYGHVSDGMICSMRELALGEEADGILVLDPRDVGDLAPGDDARPILGIPDAVLDIAVTPDRGYCLSVRGIAREAAAAFDAPYRDPAGAALELDAEYAAAGDDGWPAHIADPTGADRLVLRRVEGLDPEATSPLWLRLRLTHSGMRPLSLAVDVTNYVMLELGQPLHAFDRHKVAGALRARRAEPGERLTTLDGVERSLSDEDLVIADDRGAIALAGTMGGGSTEIDAASREIVLEAAHFAAPVIARQSRRHKLSSEASRRFERGVDPGLPRAASARAAELLAELGSARVAGTTELDLRPEPSPRLLDAAYPGRVAGSELPAAAVIRRLEQVGCAVTEADAGRLAVVPPTWRPDLVDPADFAEEVIRLEGYDRLGSTLPRVPIGIGMTVGQRHLIRATVALAMRGFVEVRNYPFTGPADIEALGLPAHDPRRRALRLANPLSDEEPDLRTTLLPGLLKALARNVGRGHTDVSVFECQRVFLPDPDAPAAAPRPPVDRRPTDDELAALDAALPRQPWRIAAAAAGAWELPGWWGPGRPATWSDAIESARAVCEVVDAPVSVRRAEHEPWHPGRCAQILLDAPQGPLPIGYAGELHPRVCQAYGVPARTIALELDLDVLLPYTEQLEQSPPLRTFPVATQDVALVADAAVPAAEVEAALRAGAGDLLESVRLFDVYTGDQVGAGRRSLAYALRFRAADRTLTAEEASAARDAAVAEATRATGAVLRG